MTLSVSVCGMPRSGNRLVQRMLERHGFVAAVRHYGMRTEFRVGGGPERAVMMLRNVHPHWKSCERDLAVLTNPTPVDALRSASGPLESAEQIHFEHFWPTLRYLAELGIPVLPVSYEAIISDPVH